MNPTPFINRMRTRQALLFDTAVLVTRSSAIETFDPDTASWATPDSDTVYDGEGLVRPLALSVDDAGNTSLALNTYVVKLPANTPVELGDTVLVTASEHDDGLVGLALRVTDVAHDEWQICRKVTATREQERPT